MMGRRLPAKSGDEIDGTTAWRHVSKMMGRAGVRARIKRGLRRRERRDATRQVEDGMWEAWLSLGEPTSAP